MRKRASVFWTRPALDSLLEITRYIQSDNPPAAHRFAATIKAKVGRLEAFPESGRLMPEFPSTDLREIIFTNYRVIYRFLKSSNSVQVLAVRDAAQRLKSEDMPA